jgi:protein-histidine pros-kinase
MNGIMGMVDLALSSNPPPELQDYLVTVQDSARSLLVILNDILDFSKVEAGKLTIDSHPCTISSIIREVSSSVAPRAFENRLEFIIDLDPRVPDQVIADSTRIRQVLVNLMSNAVKFTEKGSVTLRVTCTNITDQTAQYTFSVLDTGIGISDEQKQVVFEAFAQGDSSTTRRYGGSGLGLAISRQLVELMEGAITVESVPQKGAHFLFTVPLKTETPRIPTPAYSAPRVNVAWILSKNGAFVDVYRTQLEFNGYSVSVVPSLDDFRLGFQKKTDRGIVVVDTTENVISELVNDRSLLEDQNHEWQFLVSPYDRLKLSPVIAPFKNTRSVFKAVLPRDLVRGLSQIECIPQSASTEVSGEPKNVDDQPDVALTKSFRILVAEDNLVNQKLVRKILERAGHTVIMASNGREALQCLDSLRIDNGHQNHSPVDVVLMDIQMPEMGGIEATQAIRNSEKNGDQHIPIIALTAHAMPGHKEEYLAAGMDRYLTKPVNRLELLRMIEEVVQMMENGSPPHCTA